jgi:2-oxoglutarate dehydrogenase E2 component (dihydrolipoamide succinyltransferase)
MAQVELIMPKMGESIIEATILNWVKEVGDTVEVDDTVLEIATDKVDSEVPAPVAGTIKEIRFEPDTTVAVGEVIALIETEAGAEVEVSEKSPAPAPIAIGAPGKSSPPPDENAPSRAEKSGNGRFYSPLVRTIAAKEGIGQAELDQIPGSGNGGRVNKSDIQAYLERRKAPSKTGPGKAAPTAGTHATTPSPRPPVAPAGGLASGSSELIEMGRMRKLIADHMVESKRTSPHVTSFIEVDVTDIVNWRESIKQDFQQRHGEKITYTPIFIEAVAKAIKDFPMVNVSVDGNTIIKKHDINIGMAAALPTGNLIVPVIRNADQLNLMGLTRQVNDLAARARQNKLKPT